MKKKIFSFSILFVLSLFTINASDYLNFTIQLSGESHSQRDVNSNTQSYNEQSSGSVGFTAEYLHSLQQDGNFLVGGLFGFYSGETSVGYSSTYFDTEYQSIELKFAPSIGWAFGDTTKKKINIYPLTYSHSFLFDGYLNDNTQISTKNASIDSLGIGFDFSFQWGQADIQNGFTFGFGWDWLSIFKLDGTSIGRKNGTISGFNARIGYKISFDMFK